MRVVAGLLSLVLLTTPAFAACEVPLLCTVSGGPTSTSSDDRDGEAVTTYYNSLPDQGPGEIEPTKLALDPATGRYFEIAERAYFGPDGHVIDPTNIDLPEVEGDQ